MIRKILLLLVADARAPTFHRASVALRAYPAVEPPDLRVKGVQGAEGVFEMTWADDGRATFEHGSAVHAEETHIVWRRIGTHDIFTRPGVRQGTRIECGAATEQGPPARRLSCRDLFRQLAVRRPVARPALVLPPPLLRASRDLTHRHPGRAARPPNEIGGKTQVRVRIIQCHIVQLDKSRVGA